MEEGLIEREGGRMMDGRREEGRMLLLALCLVGLLGGGIYGYNVGASAYLSQVRDEFALSDVGVQVVSSSATVTDALAMLASGAFVLDRFGRRSCVAVGAAFNVMGCTVGAVSRSFEELVLARCLQGLGNGISILAVPMLVAESAPTKHRGFLVSFFQVGVVTGFTMPYLVQIVRSKWEFTIACGAIPGALLSVLLALLWRHVESSLWLQAQKRRSYIPVHGSNIDMEEEGSIDDCESTEVRSQPPHAEMMTFRGAIILAVVLAFINNSSDAIIFYGPQIIELAGLGNEDSLWTAFGLAAVNIPAISIVLAVVHKLARRTMMLTGLSVIIACYTMIGFAFAFGVNHITSVVVIGFLLLMLFYQGGPGTLFLIITAELFTQERRANGMAVGTAAMSIFSILCNGTLLTTMNRLGVGETFLLYAFLYGFCWLYIWMKLPETRRRRLG